VRACFEWFVYSWLPVVLLAGLLLASILEGCLGAR
jgi:hypothetical protein